MTIFKKLASVYTAVFCLFCTQLHAEDPSPDPKTGGFIRFANLIGGFHLDVQEGADAKNYHLPTYLPNLSFGYSGKYWRVYGESSIFPTLNANVSKNVSVSTHDVSASASITGVTASIKEAGIGGDYIFNLTSRHRFFVGAFTARDSVAAAVNLSVASGPDQLPVSVGHHIARYRTFGELGYLYQFTGGLQLEGFVRYSPQREEFSTGLVEEQIDYRVKIDPWIGAFSVGYVF